MVPIKFHEHIGHPLSLQQKYYFNTKDQAGWLREEEGEDKIR